MSSKSGYTRYDKLLPISVILYVIKFQLHFRKPAKLRINPILTISFIWQHHFISIYNKTNVNKIMNCRWYSFTLYFWHWLYPNHAALPAWSGFLSRVQTDEINAFLKRIYGCGFSCELIQSETLTLTADKRLFAKMCGQVHCLHSYCKNFLL